jgi:isopentenyl-diphosphate delta-isomerase
VLTYGTEIFAIYDAANEFIGTAPRAVAHAQGLYHRSVHVLLLNPSGALLIAQRSASKDLCPGLWDLSCGEHLLPGETYEQAARRGLIEELGVAGAPLQRLRPARLQEHRHGEPGVYDREFVELWQAVYDGPIEPSRDEVQAVQFVDVGVLRNDVDAARADYTPWLLDELRFLQSRR